MPCLAISFHFIVKINIINALLTAYILTLKRVFSFLFFFSFIISYEAGQGVVWHSMLISIKVTENEKLSRKLQLKMSSVSTNFENEMGFYLPYICLEDSSRVMNVHRWTNQNEWIQMDIHITHSAHIEISYTNVYTGCELLHKAFYLIISFIARVFHNNSGKNGKHHEPQNALFKVRNSWMMISTKQNKFTSISISIQ